MSTPREYLADPDSLPDAELQRRLEQGFAYHFRPRDEYAARTAKEQGE